MTRLALSLTALLSMFAQGELWAAQQYVYPAKGQTAEVQKRDEYECHVWSTQQTGYDPTATTTTATSSSTPTNANAGTAGSALTGAAAGAVIAKATDNNAGTAAAAGAVIGGASKRRSNAQATQQAQKSAASSQQQLQLNYARARTACLEGRGYTIR